MSATKIANLLHCVQNNLKIAHYSEFTVTFSNLITYLKKKEKQFRLKSLSVRHLLLRFCMQISFTKYAEMSLTANDDDVIEEELTKNIVQHKNELFEIRL